MQLMRLLSPLAVSCTVQSVQLRYTMIAMSSPTPVQRAVLQKMSEGAWIREYFAHTEVRVSSIGVRKTFKWIRRSTFRVLVRNGWIVSSGSKWYITDAGCRAQEEH